MSSFEATVQLVVQDVCPSRITRSDGERLRDAIVSAWETHEEVEVDFAHETIASISFLDEGIAALFLDYDAEEIRGRLRIVGLVEGDRRELNRLVAKRRAGRVEAHEVA